MCSARVIFVSIDINNDKDDSLVDFRGGGLNPPLGQMNAWRLQF